jgi:hypothetical protein
MVSPHATKIPTPEARDAEPVVSVVSRHRPLPTKAQLGHTKRRDDPLDKLPALSL